MTPFSDGWLATNQALVNDDPEMHVIGDWFTVTFSLTSGDARAIVHFERGRLASYVVSPRFDVGCAFGFRASPEICSASSPVHRRAASITPSSR
jgi:hypothetical protein